MAEMTDNAAHKLSMKLAAAIDVKATDTAEFEADLQKYDEWRKRHALQAVDAYAPHNPRMGKHARKIQPFLERLTQHSVPEGQAALAQHQVDQADRVINALTFQTSREGAAWTARKKKEEARDKWAHAMQVARREIPDFCQFSQFSQFSQICQF